MKNHSTSFRSTGKCRRYPKLILNVLSLDSGYKVSVKEDAHDFQDYKLGAFHVKISIISLSVQPDFHLNFTHDNIEVKVT